MIALCFTLHQNTILEVKNFFGSFKRCWSKVRPVLFSISEEYCQLMTLSQNELIPEVEVLFMIETKLIIEQIVLNPPQLMTLQIIDFDSFVQMINSMDNNSIDIKFFIEQQDDLYFGCEVIKQDETKINRLFAARILENQPREIIEPQISVITHSSSLQQFFNCAHKFECGVKVGFIKVGDSFGLRMQLINEQLPQATQYIIPEYVNLNDVYDLEVIDFTVNAMYCQLLSDICSLEDVVSIGLDKNYMIVNYTKQSVTKQFTVPQLCVVKLEKN